MGHILGISGSLFADAYAGSGAKSARSAESDFYHSAGYTLAPSVAGLNTIGASGHDFMAAVPEPSSLALAVIGLCSLVGASRAPQRERALSRA